ncbi:MAG: phosphatidate cytidylyltransferase [Akkermansiaceae bacterium]|nr:phosphatidate cytidylyltransferase [Akkermansiaceae bacterium]MCP5550947.1 phosphatidate cytidylyltransferase [Akkermansiaceae bacterium]
MHPLTLRLILIVAGILVISSIAGFVLSRRVKSEVGRSTVQNLNARIRSWWVMAAVFCSTLLLGSGSTTVLFALISFLAMREFITLNRTERADHAVLFWAFFVILPIHYFLVGIRWHGLATIFIPVYAFVLIPVRRVLTGETKNFLASTAKIQWALLVCVYAVSHMPMILALPIPGFEGRNAQILFFFVMTVQMSDVLQYIWGKLCGQRRIAPRVSPSKTWEGTVGGIVSAVALSTALSWATPFRPAQTAAMALLICLAGFFGGLVMSAIKRDLGAKDWGNSIGGHGGFMDRIDSLCFSAPLFFHLCGFYFGTGMDPSPPDWILRWLGR